MNFPDFSIKKNSPEFQASGHLDITLSLHLLFRVDWPPFVDGFTDDIDDTAEGFRAHGDLDGGACIQTDLATHQALRTVHGNGPHCVLSYTTERAHQSHKIKQNNYYF